MTGDSPGFLNWHGEQPGHHVFPAIYCRQSDIDRSMISSIPFEFMSSATIPGAGVDRCRRAGQSRSTPRSGGHTLGGGASRVRAVTSTVSGSRSVPVVVARIDGNWFADNGMHSAMISGGSWNLSTGRWKSEAAVSPTSYFTGGCPGRMHLA